MPSSQQKQPNQLQQLDPSTPRGKSGASDDYTLYMKSAQLSTPETKILNSTYPLSPASARLNPKSPLANLRKRIKEGNVCFKQAEYAKAIEIWMQALQHVPHHKGLLHNVALAYDHLGQKDKSILWLRKSAELGNRASMMVMGQALMRQIEDEEQNNDQQSAAAANNRATTTTTTDNDANADEDSVLADEEDTREECIRWFQRVFFACNGKISPQDTHTTDVHFWYQKAKKLFDACMLKNGSNGSGNGEYHYLDHPELENESIILFSPASPKKFPTNGKDKRSSSFSSTGSNGTPLNSTISSSYTGFSFVKDEDGNRKEDNDNNSSSSTSGTNLMDRLNSSEVSTTSL